MNTYTVKMSNNLTGKLKERIVEAATPYLAERKARSMKMMANGWFTDLILHNGVKVTTYD